MFLNLGDIEKSAIERDQHSLPRPYLQQQKLASSPFFGDKAI